MELKLRSAARTFAANCVLIAPLWNWNQWCPSVIPHKREVLIAPLWNWNQARVKGYPSVMRSNRTFMELKSPSAAFSFLAAFVLIAPLWNWNDGEDQKTNHCSRVLIAPLWNWNEGGKRTWTRRAWVLIAPLWNWNPFRRWLGSGHARSNRTFMELKWVPTK